MILKMRWIVISLDDTFSQFAARLSGYFDHWIQMAKTPKHMMGCMI